MNNQAHFGTLTPRMNEFREKLLDKKPYICAQRALLANRSLSRKSKSTSSYETSFDVKKYFRKNVYLY